MSKGEKHMAKFLLPAIHFASENNETQMDLPLEINDHELKVLRELGKQYAEIASLPIQAIRKQMWKKLNNLQQVKPLIWMNEVCWHEIDVNDELRVRTSSQFCQRLETELRRTIYQWKHMQGDMIVEPIINSPLIISNTGFGISTVADVAITDTESDIISRHIHCQFQDEEE